MEASLFIRNPSMSLNTPVQQSTTQETQTGSMNPSITDTTTPTINNLCTQLEGLTINEREEVINHLHVTQGESYSQLVQSAWRRRSDAEGIYLSI